MDEDPDGAVVDLHSALGQFQDKAAQREVTAVAALDQPIPVRADERFRLVASHLTRCRMPVQSEIAHPADRGTDGHIIALRSLVAGQAVNIDRRDDSRTTRSK
jgi:hypothetical protein